MKHSHASEFRGGRQWSGGIDSKKVRAYNRNKGRASEIFRAGNYSVVHSDGCCDHVWVGSNNAGVFEKMLK